MKVHHVLFLVWFILFIGWMFQQFKRSNDKYDKKRN